MRCPNHPGREASVVCGTCGQSVCGQCAVKEGKTWKCRPCAGKAVQRAPARQAVVFLAVFAVSWIWLLHRLSELTERLRGMLRDAGQTADGSGLPPPVRFVLAVFDTNGRASMALMIGGLVAGAIAAFMIYRAERRWVRSAVSIAMFLVLALIAFGYIHAINQLSTLANQ